MKILDVGVNPINVPDYQMALLQGGICSRKCPFP
jgi:hypothetical protein